MLVERREELAALRDATEAVRRGSGAVVLVEGPAGIGKTTLLEALSRADGVSVLAARANPSEVDFAHGVTRGLYEPAAPERLAEALRGGDRFAIRHALYWLALDLSDVHPLLVVVDDAHWADDPSLEALLHLAARVEGSSCGVVMSRRTGEPGGERLEELAHQPSTRRVRPTSLTVAGIAELVGDDVSEGTLARMHALTGGNPLLVREALRLVDGSAEEQVLSSLAPEELGRAVLLRLRRLTPSAPAVAQALTILGDRAPLRQVAALANLDLASAARASDALRAAEVLAPGSELAFLHPLLRSAIEEAQPAGARAAGHAAAAELLHQEGAADEVVAAHLLHAEPAGRSWAVGRLSAAAYTARDRGAPELAARLLERALAEPAAPHERTSLLVRRLEALTVAGDYQAMMAAQAATTDALDDPTHAPHVAQLIAGAKLMTGDVGGAVASFERAIAAAQPADRDGLEAQLGQIGMLSAETAPATRARLARVARGATERTAGGRALLAARAFALMIQGEQRMNALELARRALNGGLLEDVTLGGIGYQTVLVLDAGEAFEEARRLMDDAIARLAAHDANGHVFAHQQRASIALRCGDLQIAEADAQLALRLAREETGVQGWPPSLAFLIDAFVEQGKVSRAQELLDQHEIGDVLPQTGPWQWLAYSRARLRLVQERPEDALRDLEGIGAYRAAGGFDPPLNPWRALAARAALRLGRVETARELALADLAAAERWGSRRRLAIALQAVALTEDDPISTLRRALETIVPSPARLERARVQAALGAALRRNGERRQARALLRQALDGSERCGGLDLAAHIRSELEVSGARLRRERLTGPGALTPAERRTAELAATGLTNREIAQRLWVSRKTVETQLGAVYRKLGNNDRAALSYLLVLADPSRDSQA